ncbi:MAG TPA: response regulator [Burkholderiales bacterium]|nr:response regulator [Burkholderiales bacterium]
MNTKRKTGILVAEDMGEMRMLLGMILKELGYTSLYFASSGAEAVKLCEKERIRIAFLDIEMPGISGIEVMKQLHAARPECYCLIVSAHSEIENVRAALEAGARGFVVKPYRSQKIADVLADFEAAARGAKAA